MNIYKIYKNNYYIFFIFIFIFPPLRYLPQLFDGVLLDYAFAVERLDSIEPWYKDVIRYFHFYIIVLVTKLSALLHISEELIIDLLSVTFLALFCYETKKYSKLFFKLDKQWCNLAAFFTAIFPVWHTLVSFNISEYLFSFYCVLFGYRNFLNKKLYNKVIGIFFIIISFEVESSLSFVIGLSLIHILISTRDKDDEVTLKFFLSIILISFFYYFLKKKYFLTTGYWATYNELNINLLSNLSIQNLIKNIFNYLTFLIAFIWLPLLLFFKKTNAKISFKQFYFNEYFLLILLSAFAIFPYLLLNKYTYIYHLADYFQRHAFLLGPIFGIFFAKVFSDINNYKLLKVKNYIKYNLLIFIILNLTFLSYGFLRKTESFHFRYHLVEQLKTHGEIPKGNVNIITKNQPADLRTFEVSHLLFNAYGSASWFGYITKSEHELDLSYIFHGKNIEDKQGYLHLNILADYKPECKSYIYLKNDLNKINRFKKLYVFNYKKYYLIDEILLKC